MFRKMSEMLGGAQNLVRSVTNLTGSNAIADSLDDTLSGLKSKADSTSSTIESTENSVGDVARSVDQINDTAKD
jgi:methyl-accepting chemotaxis protein